MDFSNTIRSIGVGYDGYNWEYASFRNNPAL